MPVAVHLVEVLTLITLLAILTGLSIFVVVLQRTMSLTILFLKPVSSVADIILSLGEKLIIGALFCTMKMIDIVGNAMKS